MSYSSILTALKERRVAENKCDAAVAQHMFGQSLDSARVRGWFQYRKKGKVITYDKPETIAEKLRKLIKEQPKFLDEYNKALLIVEAAS